MKPHWICCVYVTLCINVTKSITKASEEALSSCLNMLEYQRDGNNNWFGLIQVQSPTSPKTLKLELLLSLPGQLPSQYVGSVELYRTIDETVRKIKSGQLVQYRVRFPLQNVLPKLDQISVNGHVRCTEPRESGRLVTRIRLHNTLFLETPQHQFGHAVEQQNHTGTERYYVDAPQRPVTPTIEICGTRKEDSVNPFGIETPKWPWLVAIYVRTSTSPSFQCGGTLVSARIVVTAASCFRTTSRTASADEVLLLLGRHNIIHGMEPGAKNASVKELVIHRDFMRVDGSKDADIAIVVLQENVEFTENIRPICLWEEQESLTKVVGQLGTVAGWGGSDDAIRPEPSTIKIPIVSNVECLRSSDAFRYILSERTFCAGNRNGMGPCNRDKGSGLIHRVNNKWMLRGIFSFAFSDPNTHACNLNEYVVFVDAAKFVTWIRTFMW